MFTNNNRKAKEMNILNSKSMLNEFKRFTPKVLKRFSIATPTYERGYLYHKFHEFNKLNYETVHFRKGPYKPVDVSRKPFP